MPRQKAVQQTGNAMRNRQWSRRDVLKTSAALAAGTLFAEPIRAAAPPPTSVTPELIEAARKEGKLSYYSALELNVAERLGKAFEAKYPGISVRVERSGAERIYQRIAQEQGSGINAVDIANSTDPAHYLDWKSKDWLAPYLPEEVAKHFEPQFYDPDALHITTRILISRPSSSNSHAYKPPELGSRKLMQACETRSFGWTGSG